MTWIARIVCTILGGVITANPIGALIGFFVGRYLDLNVLKLGENSPAHHAKLERIFFETSFSLLGCLAKSDGRISQQEITHTEQLMARMGLTPDHKRQAIELFQAGAADGFDLDECLTNFNVAAGRKTALKRALLSYMIGLALADGVLHEQEESLLRRVAASLQFNSAMFDQLIRMIRAQSHFAGGHHYQNGGHSGGQSHGQSGGQSGGSTARGATSDLATAYDALGVTAQSSDAEIKRAYRKLISENHPDKLIGQGVPEDMVKLATERSQEIRSAYEVITEHRKNSS